MRGGQPWAQSIQSRVLFSPHTRGSTPHPQSFQRGYRILPACAGVTLISVVGKAKILNSPRMRGGQPTFFMKKLAEAQFSPHVRGSTHETDTVNSDGMIHPACAGVTLSREWLYEPVYSPRMRGGQPFLSIGLSMVLVFTPHARGSTPMTRAASRTRRILPARAGVNLTCRCSGCMMMHSPRMRGGQPYN